MNPRIPREEFLERISRAQQLMKLQGIDILFAFGNEMEPQYQKYFSNFHPSFETAGVLIPQYGNPLLLAGPESKKRASECAVIEEIRILNEFRESASPSYTGIHLDTFDSALHDALHGYHPKTAAIAGTRILPFDIYNELEQSLRKYGNVTITTDTIVDTLRSVKSDNELACIRYACGITAQTMSFLLGHIKAGMTELQIKGLALGKMYELGAEGEAYPMWVLSGTGSDYAIGRARQKTVQNGELIQLQIGARYEGYASTLARPVILGTPGQWMKDSIQALYEGYDAILPELTAGNTASKAAAEFTKAMKANGYYNKLLYGPCHGLGVVECEAPWIEDGADYELKSHMTFGLDLYIEDTMRKYGIRVEDSICITDKSPLNMTGFPREIFVL